MAAAPVPWRRRGDKTSESALYHCSTPISRQGGAQRFHTKISFGIIITRIDAATNRPEAVLVRGRYSYEYSEFVHGRYSRKNVRAVSALFEAMSVNERLDIFSLDFARMWCRIWLTAGRSPELYNQKFAKFRDAWMRDDSGEYLRRLIQGSRPIYRHDGGIRLEFPKGKRQSSREPALDCAIRETEEEAGIAKRDYQILPGFKRQVSYVHMGVRYVNVYYVAIARRDLHVGVDFRDLNQVSEISEVRWMSIDQIRFFDTPDRRLENTVAPAFRYVKRYVRGRIPLRGLSFLPTPDSDTFEAGGLYSRNEALHKTKTGGRRNLAARDGILFGSAASSPHQSLQSVPCVLGGGRRERTSSCYGRHDKSGLKEQQKEDRARLRKNDEWRRRTTPSGRGKSLPAVLQIGSSGVCESSEEETAAKSARGLGGSGRDGGVEAEPAPQHDFLARACAACTTGVNAKVGS
ncbi:mRNA-decapping protein g5R [Elysia marginata]|uniref:mRNA-decapping protein g5R n=1 Tax=Elysia marginata TaxID=1093978 RepID=A0AAV4GX57_9GAST|nr:mRNA-decapping protein g5R [Elysia marginata]